MRFVEWWWMGGRRIVDIAEVGRRWDCGLVKYCGRTGIGGRSVVGFTVVLREDCVDMRNFEDRHRVSLKTYFR
jgi:hypothetical protein